MNQRTFVMIKPDCSMNVIASTDIMFAIMGKELDLVDSRLVKLERTDVEEQYADLVGLPFFEDLVEYMTRKPVFVQVYEGEDAIKKVRQILGETDPRKADPGTIRAVYGKKEPSANGNFENCAHASDSPESAAREIGLYFPELTIKEVTGNE